MLEGIKNFFSSDEDAPVTVEEMGNEETKETMKISAFSQLFPEIKFNADNINTIIEMASLTQEEIDNILSLAVTGEPEFANLDVENARARLITASKIAA
jgi:hypothetical protein